MHLCSMESSNKPSIKESQSGGLNNFDLKYSFTIPENSDNRRFELFVLSTYRYMPPILLINSFISSVFPTLLFPYKTISELYFFISSINPSSSFPLSKNISMIMYIMIIFIIFILKIYRFILKFVFLYFYC